MSQGRHPYGTDQEGGQAIVNEIPCNAVKSAIVWFKSSQKPLKTRVGWASMKHIVCSNLQAALGRRACPGGRYIQPDCLNRCWGGGEGFPKSVALPRATCPLTIDL